MKPTQLTTELQIMNEWCNLANEDITPTENLDEAHEIPEVGDTVRTKKMQMDGKVEKLGQNRAGYDEVYFRIADGRLMKTPLDNVIVVQKLADEDHQVMEQELNELSNELLSKYKTAAGKNASAADAMGDIKTGNKRFSGIVKATNKQFSNDMKKIAAKEGSMGGINRCAPAQDVSYEKVLDRNPRTAHTKVVGEDIFDEVLSKWNQINEAAPDKFTKILQQQHAQEKKTDEKDYQGWKIRYDLKPPKPGAPFRWMAWHGRSGPETAHKGESTTAKQAYQDATAWINSGGGVEEKLTDNSTIDFNREFSRDYSPDGWASITGAGTKAGAKEESCTGRGHSKIPMYSYYSR